MRARFFFRHIGTEAGAAIEQDVRVTVTEVRDVKIEPGDTVEVLVTALVESVLPIEGGGVEVTIGRPQPSKILTVKRG